MIRSAGSIIARASSGSSDSISSVEPLRSANNAVTVLRSPSGGRGGSHWLDIRPSAFVSKDDAVTMGSPSGAPQLPQKLAPRGVSALHLTQSLVSALPHRAQKLLLGGLSVLHFEQRISCLLSGQFVE